MSKKRRITADALAARSDADSGDCAGVSATAAAPPLPWPPWAPRAPPPLLRLAREAGLLPPRAAGRREATQLLRRLNLQSTFDPHGARGNASAAVPLPRSRVAELLTAGPYLLVLTTAGLCSAFEAASGRWICDLNAGRGEVVRSIFYNRRRGELLLVSCHVRDAFRALRCRAVPLSFHPVTPSHGAFGGGGGPGVPVFADENIGYPGFLEFDDTNGKALVHNATAGVYKVFDLSTYSLLHALPSAGVSDVKMSGPLLLAVGEQRGCALGLRLVSAENGQLIADHRLPLPPGAQGCELLELLGDCLAVKHTGRPLLILNATTLTQQGEAPGLPAAAALVHLPEDNAFLAVAGRDVSIWDMSGRRVCSVDARLWWPGASDLVFASAALKCLVAYTRDPLSSGGSSGGGGARRAAAAAAGDGEASAVAAAAAAGGGGASAAGAVGTAVGTAAGTGAVVSQREQQQEEEEEELPEEGAVGCIYISDAVTGERIAALSANGSGSGLIDGADEQQQRRRRRRGGGGGGDGSGDAAAAAARALADVSALFVDEATLSIYTGNHSGVAHRWGPEAVGSLLAGCGGGSSGGGGGGG